MCKFDFTLVFQLKRESLEQKCKICWLFARVNKRYVCYNSFSFLRIVTLFIEFVFAKKVYINCLIYYRGSLHKNHTFIVWFRSSPILKNLSKYFHQRVNRLIMKPHCLNLCYPRSYYSIKESVFLLIELPKSFFKLSLMCDTD